MLTLGKSCIHREWTSLQFRPGSSQQKKGTIVCAVFTWCMAGLGEFSSHVASLFFYTEVLTRLYGKLTCTQVKCSWILTNYVKEISYSPVRNINFISTKKWERSYNSAVDTVAPVDGPQNLERPCKQDMPSPTKKEMQELEQFLISLVKVV